MVQHLNNILAFSNGGLHVGKYCSDLTEKNCKSHTMSPTSLRRVSSTSSTRLCETFKYVI